MVKGSGTGNVPRPEALYPGRAVMAGSWSGVRRGRGFARTVPSGVEVGEKIAAELGRLAREARNVRLDTLAYLIKIARIEATAKSPD